MILGVVDSIHNSNSVQQHLSRESVISGPQTANDHAVLIIEKGTCPNSVAARRRQKHIDAILDPDDLVIRICN